MNEIVWEPSKELIERSNVKRLMDQYGIRKYQRLIERSKNDVEWFWDAVQKDLSIEWFRPYEKVLDTSKGIPWAKWFVGGKINIAYNCLDRHAEVWRRNKVACIWKGEDEKVRRLTYWDLYVEANRLANALKNFGVRKGETVALLLPMLPETVISFYAILKIGAIVVPIFSGFGSSAIATRLEDSEAKVLITADGTYRRGRVVKLKEMADEAAKEVESLKKLIVSKRIGIEVPWAGERDFWWDDICRGQPKECPTEPVDSEHPALLLYTSGTTGRPKGAVLSHIGALLQSSKEIYFNLDLKPEDVFLWITDIGWMMGPWQIIGVQHLCGTHLLFEGAINYPKPDRVWSLIEDFGITHLGGSATVFRMLKSFGDEWIKAHDLSSLRIIGNTGEPIDTDSWFWLLKTVGQNRCPIINLSGGTEILGCFLLPLPIMPLKPSTLGGPGLGMDIDVFNEEGKPVRGEVGYLVCKKPAPSMTKGFWKESERYLETYWSKWPNIWYHGDWASIDEDGFWFLHGRADDVIKIAGKRLGPAEVESIINEVPTVRESACIGLPHEIKGEVLVCFIALKPGYKPDSQVKEEIRNLIVKAMGKAFTPEDIVFVPDLPRNRAGKIMRRMVKAVMIGKEPGDLSVVENPEALDEIKNIVRPHIHTAS